MTDDTRNTASKYCELLTGMTALVKSASTDLEKLIRRAIEGGEVNHDDALATRCALDQASKNLEAYQLAETKLRQLLTMPDESWQRASLAFFDNREIRDQ